MQMSGFSQLEMSGSRHRVDPGGRHDVGGDRDDECQGAESTGGAGPGMDVMSRPCGRPRGGAMGVRFEDLDPDARVALMRFLEEELQRLRL
jgi:hypothetical protein